jgi:hypothetical protein
MLGLRKPVSSLTIPRRGQLRPSTNTHRFATLGKAFHLNLQNPEEKLDEEENPLLNQEGSLDLSLDGRDKI